MKFAHLADCHLGSWRDPLLAELSTRSFETAIDICIDEKVDFILIAGDLFNTSLPSIDCIKRATLKLKELKDSSVNCYMIAGSHDFSPSGKTMLDVLESAGLCINVAKGAAEDEKLNLRFTIDNKTGAKLTGLLGKKGSLEKGYYEALNRQPLEAEQGYKIFLFHSLLSELKPSSLENVDSQPLSLLPKNFSYYAGGHPHFVHSELYEGYGRIAYHGPLFPNSFKELEELKNGSFYIIENDSVKTIPVKLYDVESIQVDANHKTPEEVRAIIQSAIEEKELKNKIITLRISGTLESGRPSDINFREFFENIKEKGAYTILKNTASFTSKEFEEIKIEITDTEKLEDNLIKEHIAKDDLDIDAVKLTRSLLRSLDSAKQEGETVLTFETRIKEEIGRLIR